MMKPNPIKQGKAMEHKPWRWRRKASDRTIVSIGRASLSLERDAEQDEGGERGSRRCPSDLSEGYASVICDCNAKDEVIRKHARMAEEALAGRETAEAEVVYLKDELDKSAKQGEAAEKRLAHLEAALKDCMREIESLRGERDERLQDAFLKVTEEFERAKRKLEDKVAESNKRVSNLAAENANLMKALLCKEKLIEDLDEGKAQLEAEFDMLMARADSVERENTFLRYDCGVMEKELELRNEEREYSRRSEVESAKHIRRLEAECQQLKNLIRKRLQGPSASLIPKNDPAGVRRRSSNDPRIEKIPERPSKGTSFLIERVYDLEEENRALREILVLSDSEIKSWKDKYGQLACRLAEAEARVVELSEGENSMQLALPGLSLSNGEENRDSETWANALLVELEQFRKGNAKRNPECNKDVQTGATGDLDEREDNAIVTTSADVPSSKDSWLDEVLKVILEEHRVSGRSLGELVQDIMIVVGWKDGLRKSEKKPSKQSLAGLLTWKSEEEKGLNIEDASFTREKIGNHPGFDRSKSDNQIDATASNSHNTLSQMIKIQSALQEENKGVEERLQSMTEEIENLRRQLEDSILTIANLKAEVDILRESKGVIEDQVENQRSINEDLDTQLTVAKGKLNEILHKVSSLEVELEDKSNSCEELEATCLELQLQLETRSRKESPAFDIDQVAKKMRTEAILKALASPDAMIFDRVLCPPRTITVTQRCSLRDCLLVDNDDQKEGQKSPTIEGGGSELKALPPPEIKARSPEPAGNLAIVPTKKPVGGFGFIRRMFSRRTRRSNKMKAIPLQRNISAALVGQRDILLVS